MADGAPVVSVVIPVFNGAEFVRQAIDSILLQTFEDLEVIVVDDGSSDGSAEILASIEDPRLTVISLPQNTGQNSAARNIGIARARGSLIATLDHDDLAHPERIATQVAAFSARPELVLLGTAANVIDERGHELGTWSQPTGAKKVLRSLRWRNRLIHSSTMFRREAFDAVGGYDEQVPYCQDQVLYLGLAAHGEVDVLPRALCSYRIHGSQITQNRLILPVEKVAIRRGMRALASSRGESTSAAELRYRVWVLRHASRAFMRVARS